MTDSTDILATTSKVPSENAASIPLVKWIWQAYFKTSLIPLLLVEVALIIIYFSSNALSTRENIDTVRQMAENELSQMAVREANSISQQFKGVAQATEYLRKEAERVMVRAESAERDMPARFAYSPEGAYHTIRDNGGSALFYSGFKPIGAIERDKAMRSAGLDASFKGIQKTFPLIVQVYYNTHDSLNRIYPYFDVVSQYASHMDIPSFNFYYEADERHNPSRGVKWTEVYVDPAGQGWMTSCIAPVYRGDLLEGVVGTDVTVGTVVSEVLNLNIPWNGYGLLVSREGTIIALSSVGEADWEEPGFNTHTYDGSIKQDTFKPERFNLFKRTRNLQLAEQIRDQTSGIQHAILSDKRLISWATVPETGWKLVIVAPEENIYLPAQTLAERLNKVALLMLLGMVLFYAVFFFVLYRRARAMSSVLSEPLQRIDKMVSDIANHRFKEEQLDIPVAELDRTARGITFMAQQLDSAWRQRDQSADELQKQKQHLQSVFDLSPDAFIATDASAHVVLVNPAFLQWTETMSDEWIGLHEEQFWSALATRCAMPISANAVQQIELLQPQTRTLLCATREIYVDVAEEQANRYSGTVIYMRDITREQELVRMKSEFLALAAHELRTPLTSILGYSELMISEKMPAEMQAESLGIIHSQSKWLVKIINDLVDLSRLDAKAGRNFELVEVDCSSLAGGALELLLIPSGRDPVQLKLKPNVFVTVDISKLQQALVNVLDNAFKYSTQGKVVMEMISSVDERMIGIRVTDEGVGMTNAESAHVFERFWRADNSGKIPGTGLGMSITQEVMSLLHGTVEIQSTKGQGTIVTLWLPLISSEQVSSSHEK